MASVEIMRAKKVDGNHAAVREHLRNAGWRVFDSHDFGRNFPDLVVARRGGFTALVEVKQPGKKLKPGQQEFARDWPGVCIKAEGPEDAECQLDLAEKYQYLRGRT